MTRSVKLGGGLFIAAVASGAYWLGVLALLERATSFDYTTGAEPDDTAMMLKASAVMALGPLFYAAILFFVGHLHGLRAAAAAIGFGVIAGLYWTFIAFFLLGATAGDARDGVMPNLLLQRSILIATLIAAPTIFALMLMGWSRLFRDRKRER